MADTAVARVRRSRSDLSARHSHALRTRRRPGRAHHGGYRDGSRRNEVRGARLRRVRHRRGLAVEHRPRRARSRRTARNPKPTGKRSQMPGAGCISPRWSECEPGNASGRGSTTCIARGLCELIESFGIQGLDDAGIDRFKPRLASSRALAGRRRGTHRHAPAVHHRYLFERQRRDDGEHGEASGPAVGTRSSAPSRAGPTRPMPAAYLGTCAYLDLAPRARGHGSRPTTTTSCTLLHTGCAPPSSPGPPSTDRTRTGTSKPEHDFDFVADDFVDLSAKAGRRLTTACDCAVSYRSRGGVCRLLLRQPTLLPAITSLAESHLSDLL